MDDITVVVARVFEEEVKVLREPVPAPEDASSTDNGAGPAAGGAPAA